MPVKLAAVLIVAALAWSVAPGVARAADLFPPGTTGYDRSWPDCTAPLPPPHRFGIVGVTGGKAFNENPCLAEEFAWAAASGHQPSLYMNLKSPVGTNADEALSGPRGVCRPGDEACRAYNFGYKAAQHALAYAASQQATGAASWWLDIETMSSWSADTAMNAIVIGAAIDSLRAQGQTVGIYSSQSQWVEIAGAYAPGGPIWVSAAPDAAAAPGYCTHTFGGGEVLLVQYIVGIYDANYACTAQDRAALVDAAPVGPPGSRAVIAAGGDCLNVRGEAGFTGAATVCLASGTEVTILEGSAVRDGYRWQRIASIAAPGSAHPVPLTGWVAATYLRALGTGTASPSPAPAPTPAGRFAAAPIFGPGGQALAVFDGGSVDQLEAAAHATGATGIWAQDPRGSYQLLIVHGPAFANAAFRATFSAGFPGVTGLFLFRG